MFYRKYSLKDKDETKVTLSARLLKEVEKNDQNFINEYEQVKIKRDLSFLIDKTEEKLNSYEINSKILSNKIISPLNKWPCFESFLYSMEIYKQVAFNITLNSLFLNTDKATFLKSIKNPDNY